MMGGGGGEGCCSEVLWDTRLYHDGGGGGCCSEVLWDTRLYHDSEGVGGGGGGHGLSPRVRLITRVTKHASMPARFAGQPQKTYRHCTI